MRAKVDEKVIKLVFGISKPQALSASARTMLFHVLGGVGSASPNTCRAESALATAQSHGAESTPPAGAG